MATWLDGLVDEQTWREHDRRLLIVCPEPNEDSMKGIGDDRRDSRDLLLRPEDIHKRFYVHLRQAIRAFHNLPSRSDSGEEQDHYNLVRRIAFINLKKTGGGRRANCDEVMRATKDTQSELVRQILLMEPTHIAVAGKSAKEAFGRYIRQQIPINISDSGIPHPSYPSVSSDEYYRLASVFPR